MSSVGRNLLTYMLRSEISNARTENFNVPSIRNWFSSNVSVKPARVRRGCVETAWRNLVVQIAGSNRQKLRHPNRDVNLRHRCCHFAVVEAVDVQSDPVSYRSDEPEKAAWHEYRATSIARIRGSRCTQVRLVPGQHTARPATPTRSPEHLSQAAAQRSQVAAYHLHEHRHRGNVSANLLVRSVPSRAVRWQRRCRRAIAREQARMRVFLRDCRA